MVAPITPAPTIVIVTVTYESTLTMNVTGLTTIGPEEASVLEDSIEETLELPAESVLVPEQNLTSAARRRLASSSGVNVKFTVTAVTESEATANATFVDLTTKMAAQVSSGAFTETMKANAEAANVPVLQ